MKSRTAKKHSRGAQPNTGYGPHLDLIDIGSESHVGVVQADTAFWSLVPKDDAASAVLDGGLRRTFERKRSAFEKEMHGLRFGLVPSAVYFNPTERCNLNCDYCYLPATMRRKGRHMSADEACEALGILKAYFTKTLPKGTRPQIVFHGSEPLLARDVVFDAIDRFKDDFRFGVQTNATLLDDSAIEFLTSRGIGIGISLDGHTAAIAGRTRKNWNRQGVFDKVVDAMDRLRGYAGFNVIATVSEANVRSLTRIVDFFHKHGVSIAMLNPVRCTRKGGRDLKPDNALLAREFTKALDRTYELWQKTGRKLAIANFANVLVGIVAPAARRLMCDISPCGGGRCFFAVSARGDVFPCSEFIGIKEFCGGNLFRDSLPDILKTDPFQQVTGRVVEDIEPCAQCAIRHFCGAPCPAEVHACHGRLDKPSDYCEFYEEQARYALRVIEAGREDAYLWDGWDDQTVETFRMDAL